MRYLLRIRPPRVPPKIDNPIDCDFCIISYVQQYKTTTMNLKFKLPLSSTSPPVRASLPITSLHLVASMPSNIRGQTSTSPMGFSKSWRRIWWGMRRWKKGQKPSARKQTSPSLNYTQKFCPVHSFGYLCNTEAYHRLEVVDQNLHRRGRSIHRSKRSDEKRSHEAVCQ